MKCPQCEAENPSSSRYCSRCAAPLSRPGELRASETETLAGPPPELIRGLLFAQRYEVIEELGSGGMGKVYKVFDNKIQDTIALKIIRPELAARPKTIDRFRDEIRLARKITHKNICRMHDLNEEHGIPYISMEYVQGEDLKSIIRMMGRLSPGQAVSLGKQVCDGLAEAHGLGIVHRDLKPRNVMVDREGNARIMDFGLARSLEEKGLTGGRAMIGTAEYASPEQVKGEMTDGRSDIYSLGVILFEMVTGRLPFEGDSALSIAVKHKTEPPPDPREFNPTVPQALAEAILKCLEKDKEKRYQTAQELSAVLGEMEKEFPSEDRALASKRPTVPSGMIRSRSARRTILPGLAVLFLAAAVVVILWRPWRGSAPPLLPAGKPILAILNFANNTGDSELDIWEKGLAQDLTTELRRITRQLTVLTIGSIAEILSRLNIEERESLSSADLRNLGADGVHYVLRAAYQKDANNLRVNYELFPTEPNEFVRSGRVIMRGEANYLGLAVDLAQGILADLGLPAEPRRAKEPTSSALALKLYALGRAEEKKYTSLEVADEKAVGYFQTAVNDYEQAAREDPSFAWPHWGLGDLYSYLYLRTHRQEDLEKTCAHYERAHSIDPDSAGPNAGLGWAYFLKGENDAAFRHFKKAHELEPDNPEISDHVASFYRSIGLLEQAVEFFTRAISQGKWEAGVFDQRLRCYEQLGRFEEAAADARRAMELEPENLEAGLFYARILVCQKKYEEAAKEISTAEKVGAEEETVRERSQFIRALLLAARGEKEEALALIKPAEKKPVFFSYILSRVYAAAGLEDKAIETIRLGVEKGFEEVQDYLYPFPFLDTCFFYDSLREDPRFIEILTQQRKTYDANLAKFGKL